MTAQWIEAFVGKKHINNITNKQLATQLGYTDEYVSMILNGKKTSKNSEIKFNKALNELLEENAKKQAHQR